MDVACVQSCAVCQGALSDAAVTAVIECGHCFHEACVAKWFSVRKPHTCPLCRMAAKRSLKLKLTIEPPPPSSAGTGNAAHLEKQNAVLKKTLAENNDELLSKIKDLETLKEERATAVAELQDVTEKLHSIQHQLTERDTECQTQKRQLNVCRQQLKVYKATEPQGDVEGVLRTFHSLSDEKEREQLLTSLYLRYNAVKSECEKQQRIAQQWRSKLEVIVAHEPVSPVPDATTRVKPRKKLRPMFT